MKKILLMLVTICMVMVMGAPVALADHAGGGWYPDTGQFDAHRWNDTWSDEYCFESDWPDHFGSQAYVNARNSVYESITTEYEQGTQIDTNWSLSSQIGCTSDLDFLTFYEYGNNMADHCFYLQLFYPGALSRISYENLASGDNGITMHCDMNDNGYVDFFWVVINTDLQGSIHLDINSNPAYGEWDFPGIFTHEFGHAVGMQGHWSSGGGACPVSNSSNTMCNNTNGGTYNGDISDGMWWRTLQSGHDIASINDVYP